MGDRQGGHQADHQQEQDELPFSACWEQSQMASWGMSSKIQCHHLSSTNSSASKQMSPAHTPSIWSSASAWSLAGLGHRFPGAWRDCNLSSHNTHPLHIQRTTKMCAIYKWFCKQIHAHSDGYTITTLGIQTPLVWECEPKASSLSHHIFFIVLGSACWSWTGLTAMGCTIS